MRTLRVGDAWLLELGFYPSPAFLIFGRIQAASHSFAGFGLLKVRLASLKNVATPLQLYLKAHFVGKRVDRVEFDDGGTLGIHFSIPELCAELNFAKPGLLLATLKVPSRKSYVQSLPLVACPELGVEPRVEATGPG